MRSTRRQSCKDHQPEGDTYIGDNVRTHTDKLHVKQDMVSQWFPTTTSVTAKWPEAHTRVRPGSHFLAFSPTTSLSQSFWKRDPKLLRPAGDGEGLNQRTEVAFRSL